MKHRFYVIDNQGNTSYSVKKEAPEFFTTELAAVVRATELAESNPGEKVYVGKAVAIAIARVQKVEIEK